MKLPDSNLIKSDSDMKFLYEYDIKELFNPNKRSAERFCYETKLNLVLDMVDKVKRRENVIDIGCAQGNYTLSIAAKGIYSIGIDLRRSFIKYAKMKTEKMRRQMWIF
jgi:2-polyprenyl-3-methyl-5-hydroxy-6-metoxy-1,4-benzoquinol methylase